MRKLLCFLLGFMATLSVECQKMPLDYSALASWPNIQSECISDDGDFIMYFLNRGDMGTQLVVRSRDTTLSRAYNNIRDAEISMR